MRINRILYCAFAIIIFFGGCQKEKNISTNESIDASKTISKIACYSNIANYNTNEIPHEPNSDIHPIIYSQQIVSKGYDILIKIAVPANTEELYFGIQNSSDQNMASGFYQLKLQNIIDFETLENGFRSYLIVLSSSKDMQENIFNLVVSCKTANGLSSKAFVLLEASKVSYYQKSFKIGFIPSSNYSYTIKITSPTGVQVSYSYDNQSKSENFSNSQLSNSTLLSDSKLNMKWIDFSNPQFGNYLVTEVIEGLSAGAICKYLPVAISADGKMDIFSLNTNTSNITSTNDSSSILYTYHQQNLKVNMVAYQPKYFEMLNPTANNCAYEPLDSIVENDEEIPGVGLRISRGCIEGFNSSKIRIEAYSKDYDPTIIHYFLKLSGEAEGKISIWDSKVQKNLIVHSNKEVEIAMPGFENGYSFRDIWISADSNLFTSTKVAFIVKDELGNILSEDIVDFFPVPITKVTLKGIYTLSASHPDGDGAGHNWLTIQHPEIGVDSSYGFWPVDRASLSCRGIVYKSAGGFDNPSKDHYFNYSHTFYMNSENIGKMKEYINYIIETKPFWNAPVLSNSYDCSTFATKALILAGVKIPIIDWPNDVNDWIIQFEQNSNY
jgi:hypothetical protein